MTKPIQPQEGGSYWRKEDGSLELIEQTKDTPGGGAREADGTLINAPAAEEKKPAAAGTVTQIDGGKKR